MDILEKFGFQLASYYNYTNPILANQILQDLKKYPKLNQQERDDMKQYYKDVFSRSGKIGLFRAGLELPTDLYRLGQYFKYGDDFNDGVWIGTRGLGLLQKQQFGVLIAHWCVNIDGYCFSLGADLQWVIDIEETQDKERYDWYYYGKNQTDISDIRIFVNYINDQKIPYTIYDDNCQKFSIIIAKYVTKQNQPKYIIGSDIKFDSLGYTNFKRLITFRDRINIDQYIEQNNIQTLDNYFKKVHQQNYINDKIKKQQQQYRDFEKQGYTQPGQQGFIQPDQYNQQMSTLYQIRGVQTIGNSRYQLPTTIGNGNSVYASKIRNRSVYQPTNYNNAFQSKYDRYERSNADLYSPSLYSNQPNFNLYSNPNMNNGFITNNNATIRKSNNYDSLNSGYSSFQKIDYNLPSKTLMDSQPFNGRYQIQSELGPYKQVKQSTYQNNDYTNQQQNDNRVNIPGIGYQDVKGFNINGKVVNY